MGERARQTLPREGPTLHLDHGAAVLHLETKGIRQSIARAFLRGDGESAQSQINHSDDDHTHTHLDTTASPHANRPTCQPQRVSRATEWQHPFAASSIWKSQCSAVFA